MRVSPYRTIAKNALMSWNGLSEEKAREVALNSSFEELENQIWASNSIKCAISAISAYLGLDEDLRKQFEAAALGQDGPEMTQQQEEVFRQISEKAKDVNVNELALYALGCIHDGWVVDNAKKFNKEGREDRKYQHLPLQMIGWEEAKSDLLFLGPILETVGLTVDEKKLMVDYTRDRRSFFQKNGFINEKYDMQTDKISEAILKGKEFYPALSDENTAKSKEEADEMAREVSFKVGMHHNFEGKLCVL